VWRASLESVGAGEKRSFASLEALCDFLHSRIDRLSDSLSVQGKQEEQGGAPVDGQET
jgi:hypothetical protein